MIEVYTSAARDSTVWQPRPNDSELEAEILQRLMARYDAGSARPAAVASAGAPAAGAVAAATALPAKARLIKGADGRTERVEVDEAFDRAWRQIGLALDRGGFTVEDRDRAKGLYFVRYLDPEYEAKAREEQGFLTKLFGRDKPVPAPQYRVMVEQQGASRTAVLVFDKDGKPERTPVGDRILALLSEQLR
jgi:outer membrane protein assembly factor BamC